MVRNVIQSDFWTSKIVTGGNFFVISFMFILLLVLKLLKCITPDGGHLGFVQYGRNRGSPSWLPGEIGRRWLYLPPGSKMVLVERFEQLFD